MKEKIIEIQKEVKIGNMILEIGDKIKILSENTLADQVNKLEQKIWNSNNREAINSWDKYSDTLLGKGYWRDLDYFDLQAAIQTAKDIIFQFGIK